MRHDQPTCTRGERTGFTAILVMTLAVLLLFGSPARAIKIDDMYCRSAVGFSDRMEQQGYQRRTTMPFGFGGYDSTTSHNIRGGSVDTFKVEQRNRWVLYARDDGDWKLVQAVKRTDQSTGNTKHYICEVKSGHDLK